MKLNQRYKKNIAEQKEAVQKVFVQLLLIIFVAGFSSLSTLAQRDPAAQEILDKVAEENAKYTVIQFDFTYNLESIEDKSLKLNQSGKATLKGNKYRIEMKSSVIFSDGTDIYNYIPEAKELTITSPTENYDEFFLSKPSKIFTLYKEDFKYRLIKRYEKNGRKIAEIDLHPDNLERSYYRVRLEIDTENYQILGVEIFEKMGNRYTLTLSNYKFLKDYPEEKFSLKPYQSDDIIINDMRGL